MMPGSTLAHGVPPARRPGTAEGTCIAIHQVDVFTRVPLAGNPAAVVLDADGLTDDVMLGIAREMNLSETAFVGREDPPGVVPVRFFTPRREIPVCGHATLGAHFVRAVELGLSEGSVIQSSPGAQWAVRWGPLDGATFVLMRQAPLRRGDTWNGALRARLLEALGVDDSGLAPGSAVEVLSTGHAKVMVAVRSPDVLMGLRPDATALAALSETSGVGGYFLYALDEIDRDTLTVCRMFGPALGVSEDPVNGSGHGPLVAHLMARGGDLARAARRGFWSRMGEHLGRGGRVWARASAAGDAVEVGGYVAPVFRAGLRLDVAAHR